MSDSQALVPHTAYVEDVPDEYNDILQYEVADDEDEEDAMPAAPSPPSAAPNYGEASSPVDDGPINVFDFLVESETPTASRLELGDMEPMHLIEDVPQDPGENPVRDLARVRFEGEAHGEDLVAFGSGPEPIEQYQTPAPKAKVERRKEKKDPSKATKEEKKDKKRKRLHVDTQDLSSRDRDETMTDAPPVLAHSGLTGGLNRLLSRPSVFPPSPDYSGGDGADASPGSPLKMSKHSKRERERGRGRVESFGTNLMALINPRVPTREPSDERPKRKHRKHHDASTRPRTKQKMLTNGENATSNQMIIYQPRAETLMSFVSKGPGSEKGVSMNKALKRYHRERHSMGSGLSKAEEEKELWRSLRMKRNDRGEIVLFM